MSRHLMLIIGALVLAAFAFPAQAATEADAELAFMPRTMTVKLLNDGGKYVVIDLQHIDQGGSCRKDKNATLVRRAEPSGFATRFRN